MTALVYLLWSLVGVNTQTAPYVTFTGNILPNHSSVNLSLLGEVETGSYNNTTV